MLKSSRSHHVTFDGLTRKNLSIDPPLFATQPLCLNFRLVSRRARCTLVCSSSGFGKRVKRGVPVRAPIPLRQYSTLDWPSRSSRLSMD